MNKKISLSVIIPTYNRAHLLPRTIRSVIDQEEFLPLEIIVLDDNSSDDTLAILDGLTLQSPIPILIHSSPSNVGPSKLRNRGIDLSKGEYIGFLDSDDVWTNNKLKIFIGDLAVNPELVIWSHNFGSLETGEMISPQVEVIPFWKQLLRNYASCSCTIIKKSKIQKFCEDMRFNEDHELFTRISFSDRLYVNQSVLTLLNRGINEAGGLSGNIWKMRLGEMKTYLKTISYNPFMILFIPGLILFSLIKHIRLLMRTI